MTHDVFISYSTKDKLTADAVCANLESAGIRCWVAPRDITPGLDFPTAISNAISASRIMVLVLSTHSNSSAEVGRELILAANRNLIIIPFKIDDIIPAPGKDYYLARTHWLDAMNPPTQDQIDKLVGYVQTFLSVQAPVETPKPDPKDEVPVQDIVRPAPKEDIVRPAPKEDIVQPPVVVSLPPDQPAIPGRQKLWLWGIPILLAIIGGSIYGILSKQPGGQLPSPTVPPTSLLAPTSAALTLAPSPFVDLPVGLSQSEIETLSAEISELVTLNMPDATYTFTAELIPDAKDVSVTMVSFFNGDYQNTQSFTLPGKYHCKVSKGIGEGYLVEFYAKETWNLGPYEEATANTLCEKITRLNTALSPTATPNSLLSTAAALPAGSKQAEVATLCAEISELLVQTADFSAYTYTVKMKPTENDVSMTINSFISGEPESMQSFTLPGDYYCKVSEGVMGYIAELHVQEYWNLGLYEEATANAICDKFTRLNTILGE